MPVSVGDRPHAGEVFAGRAVGKAEVCLSVALAVPTVSGVRVGSGPARGPFAAEWPGGGDERGATDEHGANR